MQPLVHEQVGQAVAAFLRRDAAGAQAGARDGPAAEVLADEQAEPAGDDPAAADRDAGDRDVPQRADVPDRVTEGPFGQLPIPVPQVLIGLGEEVLMVPGGAHQ